MERFTAWLAVAVLLVASGSLVLRAPTPQAVAATTYSLLVSATPDRADPAPLDGQAVSGEIHVFTGPATGVSRVRFWLDDTAMSGSPRQTEKRAPYDFAGTAADDTAIPFDSSTIPDGQHTITASVQATDGTTQVLHGSFTVSNETPALVFSKDALTFSGQDGQTPAPQTADLNTNDGGAVGFSITDDAGWLDVAVQDGTTPDAVTVSVAGGLASGTYEATVTASAPGYASDTLFVTYTVTNYTLSVSTSPDRSAPTPLAERVLSGPAYVFTAPDTGVKRVRFWLDDPHMAGSPRQTENRGPYDFAGTASDGSAIPWDTTTVSDGAHTITALIERTDGTSQTLTSSFDVSNAPNGVLTFSPDALSFSVTQDGSATQTAELTSSTGGGPDFTVTDDANWLTVEPVTGTAPATLTVSVDAAGLAPGTYTATVTATSTQRAPDTLSVTLSVTSGPCGPQPCSQALVQLPYELTFDTDHGEILDTDGQGTGFTYVDMPSNSIGYRPELVDLDPALGILKVTSTAGLAFRAGNAQDNALGVGVDPRDQVTIVSATITNPPAGTGRFEQAGIWFGVDEDNYDKLVLLSTPDGMLVEHHMEVAGQDHSKRRSTYEIFNESAVELQLRADPTDRTIRGSYAVDGGEPVDLGTFVAPEEFFSFDGARIDPTIGTDTFTGILTSHRNGPAPLTYAFDGFGVTGEPLENPIGVEPYPFVRHTIPVPNPTSMVWGPDGRLYVTELFGQIHALTLDANKKMVADEVITTIGARLTLGIEVDPASTPDNVILWVSHSNPSINDGEPNSSMVTKLWGPGFGNREDVITGLPRAKANHAVNSIHFGPDGRLYIAAGGNTGAGAPNDSGSEFGTMEEQPLSAAILVADVKAAGFDGSCHNETNIFGPPPCDVTPWATGLRNIYDFVWHTNGSMYGPDNGLGVTGTYPPSPTPPCFGMGNTASYQNGGHNPGAQPDTFHLIEQGRYYGHPNPYRDECVFMDGSYQGVAPMASYTPPIHNLGDHRSANGTIEYQAPAFGGALNGAVLVVNYAVGDNITMLRLAADGRSVVSSSNLAGGFDDPLPLTQDPDGVLYVGEFGSHRISVLVPDDDRGAWSAKAPMPQAVLDAGGAALNGKLYSVAGKTSAGHTNGVRVYDPGTDSWSAAAPLPGPAVENPAVVAHDGKLYAFGGSTEPFAGAVTNSSVYDPATDTWTSLPPMPTARAGAAAQVLGTSIYVAGGMDGTGASVDAVEVFDPLTGSWSTAPAMSTRRDNPGSAVLNGQLYLFGGRTRNADGSGLDTLKTVESFHPVTGAWTARTDMPTPRRTMVVGTLNGRAQVMGGEKAPDGNAYAANEEYNPLTNTWRILAPMQTPRHGAAAATISGVVYVSGGGPVGGTSFTDVTEAFAFGS